MNKRQELNYHFLIAFGILNTVSLMLVLSSFSFLMNLSLSPWHFPLSVCGSILINYFACGYYARLEYKSVFVKTTSILIALIVLAIALALPLYDSSWDGQWYHQEAVIQLRAGWNPFYSHLRSKEDQGTLDYKASLQINHFAKGPEIASATIYAFLKKIEAGKATNIFLLFASFFLCVLVLSKIRRLSVFKAYLISCLAVLNPIAVNQLFTNCVDGQLGSLLCCLLAVGCLLFIRLDRYELILLCSLVIITINTKATALVFAGVFIGGLLIVMLYNRKKEAKEIFIAVALSLTIGIGLVGYNPYVTNTIDHGNPFYPVVGKDKVDILEDQVDLRISDKSRFEKLLISTFSHPSNAKKRPELKIPFMFYETDIVNSALPDTRIGGFGFLFEEIILLSAVMLGIILWRGWAKGNCDLKYLMYILVVLLVSVFMIPEPWWARYVPQFWFVPVIILICGELIRRTSMKYLRISLYLLLAVNSAGILVFCFKQVLVNSIHIDYQLAQFAAADGTLEVDFGLFKSIKARFDEHKIKYREGDIDDEEGVTYIEGSFRRARVGVGNVPKDVPKPILMRLLPNLKGIRKLIERSSSATRHLGGPAD